MDFQARPKRTSGSVDPEVRFVALFSGLNRTVKRGGGIARRLDAHIPDITAFQNIRGTFSRRDRDAGQPLVVRAAIDHHPHVFRRVVSQIQGIAVVLELPAGPVHKIFGDKPGAVAVPRYGTECADNRSVIKTIGCMGRTIGNRVYGIAILRRPFRFRDPIEPDRIR